MTRLMDRSGSRAGRSDSRRGYGWPRRVLPAGHQVCVATGVSATRRPQASVVYNEACVARRTFFCTFPMVLRGSAATRNMRFGSL